MSRHAAPNEFVKFPSLSRWNRDIIISEKIDGTNACVAISTVDSELALSEFLDVTNVVSIVNGHVIRAASRTRWVTPGEDNYGFAAWVEANAEDLVNLGVGRHYGEWWGKGINRNYGLDHKRFSLFNTYRWCEMGREPRSLKSLDPRVAPKLQEIAPLSCSVVPVMYWGAMSETVIDEVLIELEERGSVAMRGFMKPEGIVVFHTAANSAFKITLDHDGVPKSLVKEIAA